MLSLIRASILFSVASNLDEVKLMVGIDPISEDNLHSAFNAVLTGDERPLLKMGMPQEEWFDVQYMLNRLVEGGLVVWHRWRLQCQDAHHA